DFLIERLPECPQVIVVSPCSGHGFKFAPVIGEIVAELASTGATRHDIAQFSLMRLVWCIPRALAAHPFRLATSALTSGPARTPLHSGQRSRAASKRSAQRPSRPPRSEPAQSPAGFSRHPRETPDPWPGH